MDRKSQTNPKTETGNINSESSSKIQFLEVEKLIDIQHSESTENDKTGICILTKLKNRSTKETKWRSLSEFDSQSLPLFQDLSKRINAKTKQRIILEAIRHLQNEQESDLQSSSINGSGPALTEGGKMSSTKLSAPAPKLEDKTSETLPLLSNSGSSIKVLIGINSQAKDAIAHGFHSLDACKRLSEIPAKSGRGTAIPPVLKYHSMGSNEPSSTNFQRKQPLTIIDHKRWGRVAFDPVSSKYSVNQKNPSQKNETGKEQETRVDLDSADLTDTDFMCISKLLMEEIDKVNAANLEELKEINNIWRKFQY